MDIVRKMLKLFVPSQRYLLRNREYPARERYLREHPERGLETQGISKQDDGAWHSRFARPTTMQSASNSARMMQDWADRLDLCESRRS
ncbi:MAG: hypothetical protein LBB51_06150 [Zoogloeaceae bacterium]|jgi:hypothetical protein|nr:hypothetical protein [Zoogloeaceae bacterium]